MNKKMIALALAGAFAAPAVMAADAAPSAVNPYSAGGPAGSQNQVTIYGIAAPSVDLVDGGSGGPAELTNQPSDRRGRVSANVSVIGFKGAEALGNGLSAVWQYETQIGFDENAAFSGGREAFAGLHSSAWGRLTAGLQDTPVKVSTGKLDVFGGGQYLADYRSLFGGFSNGSIRANNSIQWISPSYSGFTARVLTAAMRENGSTINPHLWSASGTYENGPLFATLAYEDMEYGVASGTVVGAGGNNITATGAAVNEQRNARVGFGYSFGNFRLGLGYERAKAEVNTLGTSTLNRVANGVVTPIGTAANVDRNAWYLSGAFRMGSNTLKAAYTRAGDVNGADSGAQQYSLGMNHSLSKRTELYALITQVRNESNASYSLGGGPVSTGTFQSGGGTGVPAVSAAAPGQDPRGISVGMIHRF